MRLEELLKGVSITSISMSGRDFDMDISGIFYDSGRVREGGLFVAMHGEKADGHNYIEDAVRMGAAVIVHEKELNPAICPADSAFVRVNDSRQALALISNNYFGNPSNSLNVIGITGTNGKTTTTYLIKSILEVWGKSTGLIGTIQYMIKDEVHDAKHTTPESPEFQALLHDMLEAGCSHVVTEVSSHALAQKRVDGTVFRTAVFTNLTRDHLDFHKTMEEYFESKKRLFTELLEENGVSVINLDDPWGRRLNSLIKGSSYTYGLETGSDIMATDIQNSFEGLSFRIIFRERSYNIKSNLVGLPNVYNILSAAGAAISAGVPWNIIAEGIRKAEPVRGRFEKVGRGQKFLAVVDYAHTEDALERLIYTARGLTKGKIITVFGCGGDRDRGKRPRMGAIATRLSDFVIMTSDNPRSEKPEDIIKEIEAGAVRRNYLVEPDRKEAIRRAVLIAEESDVLLVAGKGHEQYQEAAGMRSVFNDREVLEDAIRQLINNV